MKKSETRRTKQISVTISKKTLKKLAEFGKENENDSWLRMIPRSALISIILDWALNQEKSRVNLVDFIKKSYLKETQAWYRSSIKKSIGKPS